MAGGSALTASWWQPEGAVSLGKGAGIINDMYLEVSGLGAVFCSLVWPWENYLIFPKFNFCIYLNLGHSTGLLEPIKLRNTYERGSGWASSSNYDGVS